MGKRDNELRWEYEENGVTMVPAGLSSAELVALTHEVNSFIQEPRYMWKEQSRADDPGRFLVGAFMSRWNDVIRRIALESDLPRLASTVLNTGQICFFYDQLFFKKAGTTTKTQLHQDLVFWPFAGVQIPSLWVALSETSLESSAVCYVPGSHRGRRAMAAVDAFETNEHFGTQSPSGVNNKVGEHRPDRRSIAYELKPGDVVIHHPMILHSAGGNQSDADRIGLSFRYLGPDVVWSPRSDTMFVPGVGSRLANGQSPFLDDIFPVAMA